MSTYIDIHTHQLYSDKEIKSIYNSFLTYNQQINHVSYGIHPWYIGTIDKQINQLEYLINKSPNAIAIGECGLDKLCNSNWTKQVEAFEQQIALANKYKKPIIIHCVKAYQECLQILKQANTPVIFHGFNKNKHLAKQIIDNGYYISLSLQKDSKNPNLKTLFENIDLQNVFLETDDSKISIVEVYNNVTQSINIELEELKETMFNNYNTIFGNQLK